MLHQAKWIGVSLALHLAAATGFTVLSARNAERTPKAIMVMLDNLDPPTLTRLPASQVPVRAVVRPTGVRTQGVPNALKPETVKSEPAPHAPQPVVPGNTIPIQAPDQRQTKAVAATVPERTATGSAQHVPASPFPHPVLATAPEKTNQHYLKEHFIYIRDLISKQIVYPSMARKMGWSGKVTVAFVITEDGSVQAIRVVESSGFPLLDKSAVETVRGAAPFPKPPVRAEIVVPVNFKLMP
jgi:protein TonB